MSKPAKIVYVTRDIERALGMEPGPDYRIIANKTAYSESIKKTHPDFITLVESNPAKPLDTLELLQTKEAAALLNDPGTSLLVFKNTKQIEELAGSKGWKLLNPSASLAEKIENKITQIEWLGESALKYLPAHTSSLAKNLKWERKPFVLQWAHGHTGDSTMIINSADELKTIQQKFPDREARTTEFVRGPSFTVNIVVAKDAVVIGNPSFQITGLPPFTDNVFSTIGNDWSATHSFLSESELAEVEAMAAEIGAKMQRDGWLGLFGIDIIHDIERGRICLIEINARQPASAAFESVLQTAFRNEGLAGMTTFEAHLRALTGETVERPIHINDGAQLLQRVTRTMKTVTPAAIASLMTAGYNLIPYSNTAPNLDLLRIQSMLGIMESANKFNARGQAIADILT